MFKILLTITTLSLVFFAGAMQTVASPQAGDITLEQKVFQEILSTVLIHDTEQALTELNKLQHTLKMLETDGNIIQTQKQFIHFMTAWKKVQTAYIAGFLNEDLLDHPRYIDTYHQGNEDIGKQLSRVLKTKTDVSTALFKHSYKTINALEYVLFTAFTKQSTRSIQIAKAITQSLERYLKDINETYTNPELTETAGKAALSQLANSLLNSSYQLHAWRTGEAGGFIAKYQDKPSIKRLEYYRSTASLQAIHAILETHQRVIGVNERTGLAKLRPNQSEVSFLQRKLKSTYTATLSPTPLTAQVKSKAFKNLYTALKELHDAYFLLLIDALGLQAKILDADGD